MATVHSNIDMDKIRGYWQDLQAERSNVESNASRLTEDLIDELAKITHAYEEVCLDKEREIEYTRRIQKENHSLKNQLRGYETTRERDSSILVLIDGDGLLFDDGLVQQGERGGTSAAAELFEKIQQYVRNNDTIPTDAKVAVRIFANLQGLTKTYEAGDIADGHTVAEFARGFTMARSLFDFVDCGSGKERADSKIRGSFNLSINSLQCRHIILGCSHDNGYARMLEDLNPDDHEKISLLEGVPFSKELATLAHRFRSTRFHGLFRTSKIDVYNQYRKAQYNGGQQVSPTQVSTQLVRGTTPSKANGLYSSPYEITSSGSTAASESLTVTAGGIASPPPANNWAGKAMAAAALPAPPIKTASPPSSTEPSARKNRKGQRLDPAKPKEIDLTLLNKVQSMKLCNNFFLKGFCHNTNAECGHDHYYKPNSKELAILKYIARRIPCPRGTGCDDPRCTAGHRCAFMEQGECRFQVNGTCKFGKDMHYTDLTEVKTVAIR